MRRGTGAVAAALVISVALAWGAPVAAGQQEVPEGGIETRVGARFVDGGRVEVALQVRSDGAWGDSLLPARRFMPAPGKHSRWLSTSPIALQGAEARVVARRLADGVVTVALRARTLDGDWGERLLPRQRLLYASSQRGVWLWSSPVTLDPPAAQIVAFYGHPGVPAMGVLGHGTPAEIAAQMAVWVDRYDRLNGPRGAIGAFHLITGVAQANPTTDGTWIYRLSHERIATYVEAAREHGMLLFLDNQI
ncbi:MAG: hypothetical protein F4X30_05680, partial [Acidimicrobiaceae bacterium]|nr:hypothetical protein [Acidimicrobiaceae bacterium]